MRYERHPEINEGWARLVAELRVLPGGPPGLNRLPFPQDSPHTETGRGGWLEQAEADLVAYANSYGIEVIPKCSRSATPTPPGPHPELAERAWDPGPTPTARPTRTYEPTDVLEEDPVFRPRMIHIGHDEAYTFRGATAAEARAGEPWRGT